MYAIMIVYGYGPPGFTERAGWKRKEGRNERKHYKEKLTARAEGHKGA